MSIEETSASARLFFALWPDEATRRQVVDVQNCLRHEVSGRWIQPDNLHVTLAFLGQVRADRLSTLRQVAAVVLGESLELTLDRVVWWRQPQVLCLTSGSVPETLLCLVTSLSRGLAQEGFDLDQRPFRVHMTLARKVRQRPPWVKLEPSIPLRVTEFGLVRSCRSDTGSTYTRVDAWPLQGAGSTT